MRKLRVLALAPAILVLSLAACAGAKLSEDKAKERAEGYDAAAVVEKYASVEVTTKVDVKKNTGVFADDGLMAAYVKTIKAQAGTEKEEGDDLAEYVWDAKMGEMYEQMGEGYSVTYYSYKSKGLKVEVKIDAEVEETGMKQTSKGTANTFILDDGRMEKGDSNMKMTVSGSYGGVTLEGELEYTMSMTAKWTAK